MFRIVLAWESFKDWLSASVHLTHWDLHVIVGLLGFFGFGRLMRRPITSSLPIVPIAVLELLNELSDFLRAYVPDWPWAWRDTIVEIGLTLLPPLLVVVAARLLRARRRSCASVA